MSRAAANAVWERKPTEVIAGLAEIDLSSFAAEVAVRHQDVLTDMIDYDVELVDDVPLVVADEVLLADMVGRLIRRAAADIGGGWGTITLWTGILGDGLGPIFAGNLLRTLGEGHWAFLEVHDTGGQSSSTSVACVTEPFLVPHSSASALRYATAERLVRSQGGALRLESSYPGGTSVVFLFPFASEDSGWSRFT